MSVVWRLLVTIVAWFIALSMQVTDGQTFRHSIELLIGAVVGCLPWIPLLFDRAMPRRRLLAIAVVSASALLIVLIGINLPSAYEYQQQFNQAAGQS